MNKEPENKEAKAVHASIDVKELLDLLHFDSRTRRIVSVVLALKELADNTSFPINSCADLMKRLRDKPLVVDGQRLDTSKLESMPKYYFPIASRENLIEKGQELFRLSNDARFSPTLPLPPPRAAVSFRTGSPFGKSGISESAKER
jgi:hypothetical protein